LDTLQNKLKRSRFVLHEVTLAAIWDSNPIANAEVFKSVIRNAQGEQALENFINSVKKHWEEYLLDIVNYKGKVNLLRGWDLLFEKLAEHLGSLSTMKMSPYYTEFKATANEWDDNLNRIRCVLEVLVEVQRRWIYLDGIFSGSQDIRRQLPVESSQFDKTAKSSSPPCRSQSKAPTLLWLNSRPPTSFSKSSSAFLVNLQPFNVP